MSVKSALAAHAKRHKATFILASIILVCYLINLVATDKYSHQNKISLLSNGIVAENGEIVTYAVEKVQPEPIKQKPDSNERVKDSPFNNPPNKVNYKQRRKKLKENAEKLKDSDDGKINGNVQVEAGEKQVENNRYWRKEKSLKKASRLSKGQKATKSETNLGLNWSISSEYEAMLKLDKGMASKPISYKCEAYFRKLLDNDMNWYIDIEENPSMNQYITSNLRTLNIFTNCFIKKEHLESGTADLFATLYGEGYMIEKRLFPYLNRRRPIFIKWDGSQSLTSTLEKESNILFESLSASNFKINEPLRILENPEMSATVPYFSYHRENFKNSGIAIFANSANINQIKGTIRNLRFLDNNYPIQILFNGDLSPEELYGLTFEARSDNILKEIKKTHPKLTFSGFPVQNIEFIDISAALSNDYQFAHKNFEHLFAFLFSTFEHCIFLDPEVVLYDIKNLGFENDLYKQNGAILFKDLVLKDDTNHEHDEFLILLLPNKVDEELFKINNIIENDQFKYFQQQLSNYIDSKVVVLNRLKYFAAALNSIQLSFSYTISKNISDIDIIWLGILSSGVEKLSVSDGKPGIIGTLISDEDDNNKICSSHVAHFNQKNEIIWMSGNVINCNSWSEYEKETEEESLLEFYRAPLNIEAAIIPLINSDDESENNDISKTSACSDSEICITSSASNVVFKFDEMTHLLFDFVFTVRLHKASH
ncbi:hypothetical protein DAMA08_031540 [Martiniozyma asiatica (nom. inval.)]|nr:hypothetical protein DAMA08_031540 [Martiniozyma asiatica]